ncbi:MAG: type III-B CRISPR module RAMP protein Cmr4 [Candidatus Methanomethylicia archaeon]
MSKELVASPYDVADLVFIKAVTNLHPGVGRTGEMVDLPVQKDNFGFPIIYSSSLKGALKSAFWNLDPDLAKIFFGPEPEEGEKFASAIAILDAFVVAFPVRSLEGVYAFATSPLLLNRFNEYLNIVGNSGKYKPVDTLSKTSIGNNECYTSLEAVNILSINIKDDEKRDKKIVSINEEIDLKVTEKSTEKSDDIKKLEELLDIEKGRLILLNDNDALRAMERSLVRVVRIALERETKTVRTGALWTEEYIPYSTVFATAILYSNVKRRKTEELGREAKQLPINSREVRDKFHELLGKLRYYLIIGGNETVGRGIVKLILK